MLRFSLGFAGASHGFQDPEFRRSELKSGKFSTSHNVDLEIIPFGKQFFKCNIFKAIFRFL